MSKAKLKDLCLKIGSGATPKGGNNVYLDKGNYSLIRSQNIYNEGFSEQGIVYISDADAKKLENVDVKEDDVLINITGDSVARVSLPNKKYLPARVNQHVSILRANPEKLDFKFLKYVLVEKSMQEYLLTLASSGATRNALTKAMLENIEIDLPSLNDQKRISNFLSKFDEKIQINTQINQILEQIAQALFKSWFVDFDPMRAKVQALSDGLSLEQAELAAMQAISGKTPEELTALSQTQPDHYAELAETAKAFPCEMVKVDGGEVPKGWEQTTLSDICEMQNGYAFKSSDWMEQGIPVIKIGSVKPMIVEVEGNGFVSEDYSKLKPDFLLKSGDILVGLTGYVGEVGRIPTGKIAMLNQRVAKFLPKEIDKNHCFYNYIYCLARQSQFKEFAEMNAKGSAQANISTKELLKFPIIKANDELHIFFENRVKELLESILWNSQNSETLAKTRDLLLPRLLDGSI